MTPDPYEKLSRLERQIMDALYRLGSAPVADVVAELGAQDGRESVRVTMSNLEKKGFLTHQRVGPRNVYEPTVRKGEARDSLTDNLLKTFFAGSPRSAILSLLDRSDTGLSAKDVAEIRARIRAAEERDASEDPGPEG